jgi:hypothetical protein
MPLHSVRFDEETEQALVRVCDATGSTPSEVLKEGVVVLAERVARRKSPRPFEIYRQLDLGPGGYARAPARRAKDAIRAILRRKHGR